MGSGTGGFEYIPSKTEREAENLFRTATSRAEQSVSIRNVFISFSMDDVFQVNLLREQAANENFGLEFKDYSVKEPFDDEWRKRAAERISMTSATIVMIGEDTANRPAVKFEIEESYRQSKKVLGVRIYKSKNHQIPALMKKNNAPIVDWKMEDIQRELDKQ